VKLGPDAKTILKGPQVIQPAPKRPFTYGQLPGGSDPVTDKFGRH
jgi:hypothetical protein